MDVLKEIGGLSNDQIAPKLCLLVSLCFEGVPNDISQQIKESYVSYVEGIYYMAHQTNLAVQGLSHLPIMNIIESLFSSFYTYFSHNPKKHLKFPNMAKMMNSKRLKIVFSLKTR
jgi:hypothetical protein